MKTFPIIFSFILLISLSLPAAAQSTAKTGYSTGAYNELDSNRTYLQKVSDWFATAGKTEEEKAIIMSQRRNQRRIVDAQKKIEQKKKEIVKQKKEALKELKEKD